MLAIIVPTYNREKKLKVLLDSAVKQNNKDFVMYILDDGSTDETAKMVSKYKSLNIVYKYNYNVGKYKTLVNNFKNIKEDIFVIVDSDSIMESNFVDTILKNYYKYNDEKLTGFFYPIGDLNTENEILGEFFPKNYEKSDFFNGIEHVAGDKSPVIVTKYINKVKFKTFKNEKFMTEAVFMNQMATMGFCVLINDVILRMDYQEDGLTKNMDRLVKENPKGYILYNYELLKMKISFKRKLRAIMAMCYHIFNLVRNSLKWN